MSQKNPPGYPLPSGELGNDEIVCQLVYLPNRDEYWQAFLGALSYMATWRAWERDDDKRGRDAASNWREAFELTMECWRMACLGELKQDVSDILDHLRNAVPCCGDIVIYGDSTVYITTIIPGVGDDPTHYGETEVTDWDEWSEYLCHNAHLWVDELAKQSNQLELALSVGGMSLGLAGFIVAAIVLFVVGGFLSGVVIMAIVSGVVAGYTANMFSTAADDIDAAREDIICAIINGASLADAVENALASGLAWDIFFSQLDYDSAIAILYEGGNGDDVFLEAEKRTDCQCTSGYELYILPAPGGSLVDQTHFSPIWSSQCWRTGQMRVKSDVTGLDVPWKLVSVSAIGNACASHKYRIYDYPGEALIYDSTTPPSNISNCKFLSVQSSLNHANSEIIWTV